MLKLCQTTSSQESKFRNCPFAGESETFMDSNADAVSSSTAPTSSEPTEIVMVSLPDSSSSIEQSTGQDDEQEFHTPPEHRFSSSEDQNVDGAAVGGVSCLADEDAENLDSDEGDSASGFVKFKKIRARKCGLGENPVLKKARVHEDLDLELEDDEKFGGKKENVVIEISSDLGSEEIDKKAERATMAVESPMKSSTEDGGVAEKVEAPEIGESSGGVKNGKLQTNGVDGIVIGVSKNYKKGKVNESIAVKVTEGEKALETGNREACPDNEGLEIGESSGRSENGKLQTNRLDETVVEISKNKRKNNVTDVVKVNECEKAQENGGGEGGPKSAKNVEEIEKFKYVPPNADVGRREKNKVVGAGFSVGGKRELPPSMKGKEKNVRSEVAAGKARTMNGRFLDLLEVLNTKNAGLGDAGNTSDEEVDFLGTAKRRGLTFPRPRWWPPEGDDD